MSLMSNIGKVFLRAGRQLGSFGQSIHMPKCPGKITVNGKVITELMPQGGYKQWGITKAGRVSFSGYLEGKRVKIYSSYSPAHSRLRERLESTDIGQRFFPRLIISDEDYMVEEWIDGLPLQKLDRPLFENGAEEIKSLLTEFQESQELIKIAEHFTGAFCYFQDYLLKRIEQWCVLDFVRGFKISWMDKYEKVKNKIAVRLSHPDLSAANILRETDTGRFVIIDNELLGVGHGWILDRRNSFLKSFEGDAAFPFMEGIEREFVQKSWKLRLLGSALDASDFDRAYRIAVNSDF